VSVAALSTSSLAFVGAMLAGTAVFHIGASRISAQADAS
jgi:hypothetical protein